MAANVTTMKGGTINITLAGDVDWEWDSATEIASAPQLNDLRHLKGLFIHSISFDPNAAGDKVSIRECAIDGPVIFHASGSDTYDQRSIDFRGAFIRGIYIDKDDVTSDSDAATVRIILA